MIVVGPRRRNRTGLLFAILVAVSLLMLLASRTEPVLAVQDVTGRLVTPVTSAISGLADGVIGVFGTVGEIERLRSDNTALREDLAEAREGVVRLGELEHENEELRRLLGIDEALDFELLSVRLIARDPGNFTREIGIDAGTDDGVRIGMVVVGGSGGSATLIGRVTDASTDRARVQLVIDTRSSVIALDQQTRAVGVVHGQLGGQLALTDVPVTEELAVGDMVLTAGLEVSEEVRSGYPAGLLIGVILDVEEDPNGLTQTAFVEPAADFDRLDRLLVILDDGAR